jgi:hypothetical protein
VISAHIGIAGDETGVGCVVNVGSVQRHVFRGNSKWVQTGGLQSYETRELVGLVGVDEAIGGGEGQRPAGGAATEDVVVSVGVEGGGAVPSLVIVILAQYM